MNISWHITTLNQSRKLAKVAKSVPAFILRFWTVYPNSAILKFHASNLWQILIIIHVIINRFETTFWPALRCTQLSVPCSLNGLAVVLCDLVLSMQPIKRKDDGVSSKAHIWPFFALCTLFKSLFSVFLFSFVPFLFLINRYLNM